MLVIESLNKSRIASNIGAILGILGKIGQDNHYRANIGLQYCANIGIFIYLNACVTFSNILEAFFFFC